MTNKVSYPYGRWPSPITSQLMAQSGRIHDVFWDEHGALVWAESQPEGTVLRIQPRPEVAPRDLNDMFSVRGRVGFGGGAFSVGGDNVYFVDAATGRLYRQALENGSPEPLTPSFGGGASPCPSPDGRWLIYVHSDGEEDVLAVVDTGGAQWPKKLVFGDDFYMQPAWHPGGEQLAWIAWDHPNMPWDGTRLVLGKFDVQRNELPSLGFAEVIAGDANTAVMQPTFSPDGQTLVYLSDQAGYWHLYAYDLHSRQHRPLTIDQADYGQPAWIQGVRTFTYAPDNLSIITIRFAAGLASLRRIWLGSGETETLEMDERYTWFEQPAVHPDGEQVAVLASGPGRPNCLIVRDAAGNVRQVAGPDPQATPAITFSSPEVITWKGEAKVLIHGLFYRPDGDRYESEGLPPLIVYLHSGPTSQATTAFDLGLQFFTTRGYAVLAVNYRGSTGYGREYWQALQGQWGILDVQDAVSGAHHLISVNEVNKDQMAIMGGSAGGFTVLRTLIEHPGLFRAGICRYPVVNLLPQAEEHFKFEAFYQEKLVGKLPEAAEIYRDRSPLSHADRIRDPLAIFHGDADPVVPYTQSEALVQKLREQKIPHEYYLFPGEGHGFRNPETTAAYYKATLRFLEKYLG